MIKKKMIMLKIRVSTIVIKKLWMTLSAQITIFIKLNKKPVDS